MKTLEEHNDSVLGYSTNTNRPRKNNIACPNCGEELYDTNPLMSLASHPPQYQVHCGCGYSGTRY